MKTRTAPILIIFLLLILYILQGVIIGFITAISLYLDSRGAKWREQATFNFVFYPFSLKLAWAPIIDAIYITRIGRRKTWLIPIQYVIGITLFILSFYLTKLIEELQITFLTLIFFFIYFLLASQDICVDGWALTLLKDYNLQWASTCQTVGQTIGRFTGFTILMTLESANFVNQFLRKPFSITEKSDGLFTIDQFLRFWAIAFLLISSCIGLLIKEKQELNHLNLKQTYFSIFKLFQKKCLRQVAFLFLISPIGYAATYAMTNLVLKSTKKKPQSFFFYFFQFIRYGVPKETLGLIGIPLILVKILIPFFIIHTNHPLTWYYRSYVPRLVMCIVIAIYICFTPYILSQWYFYPILIALFMINESFIYLMVVARVGFYAQISDPCIGGTYMTLLTMLGNLGASLTSSIVLYTAEWIKPDKIAYPLLVGICVLCGCLWLSLQYKTMIELQKIPIEVWHLSLKESDNINVGIREKCLDEEERDK